MMRKFLFISFLVFGFSAVPCLRAADKLSSLFPDHFGPWTASSAPVKVAGPDTPTAAMDTNRTAYSEAGLKDYMRRTYTDGHNEINVTLGEFRDPSGAYEAYTAGLQPGMNPSSLGPPSAVDNSQLLAQLGNFIFGVSNPRNISEPDLQSLVQAIREHADKTPLPPIRTYLPENDLVDGTQRYTLGPTGFQNAAMALHQPGLTSWAGEVGFASGAEVMFARYQKGRESGVLLLIDYPTPQIAEQHLRHLQKLLLAGARPTETTIRRKGSLLSVVLEPTSEAYALSLVSAVNYETQVTWNEPTHELTDPPWTSVLSKIIIGTGVLMIIAVVMGVAFGGMRVVTKVFFPGKVFDRPEQMEVLQLGLSKRIDSHDFR
jgi:hypothetical protein